MDYHSLIHRNLQQLDVYQPISFTFNERMFEVPNIKKFQKTMNYLLNVIDSTRCKELIEFPVLDKKAESKFRVGVKTFLMEINERYPVANLPRISQSFLMNRGGEKFAHFMWKLTSFVLLKTLMKGDDEILLPPRILRNNELAASKLTLLHQYIEFETKNSVEYQLKLDSITSQKCEWECNMELKELDEKIRYHEAEVKELIRKAPVSPLVKAHFDQNNSNAAISEWKKEIELEARTQEAMVHVLSKHTSSLAEHSKTVSLAESYKTNPPCIDVYSIIESTDVSDPSVKELFQRAKNGEMTLTEFLQSLNEILNPVILKVNSSIPDYEYLSKLASDLKSASRELEEGEQSYADMEKKLQEKLTEFNLSLDEILNDSPSEETEAKEDSRVFPDDLDFPYPSMLFSPNEVLGAVSSYTKSYENIKKEMENACSTSLMEVEPPVMTPESDWSCNTPSTSFRREIGTPLTFSTIKSSNKKESDLRTLTSSLLRKRYSQMSAEKSTEKRELRSEPKPVVNKKLFVHSEEPSQSQQCSSRIPVPLPSRKVAIKEESVKLPTTLSEETERCWELLKDDIFDEKEEGEDTGLFSPVLDDKDVRFSPSLLLSTVSTNDEQASASETSNRRKSLEAIIQRYLKVRKNMD